MVAVVEAKLKDASWVPTTESAVTARDCAMLDPLATLALRDDEDTQPVASAAVPPTRVVTDCMLVGPRFLPIRVREMAPELGGCCMMCGPTTAGPSKVYALTLVATLPRPMDATTVRPPCVFSLIMGARVIMAESDFHEVAPLAVPWTRPLADWPDGPKLEPTRVIELAPDPAPLPRPTPVRTYLSNDCCADRAAVRPRTEATTDDPVYKGAPGACLDDTEVSDTHLVATVAVPPIRARAEASRSPREAPKMVTEVPPVVAELDWVVLAVVNAR
mmetsp:Transcript_16801/g.39604  ORF Transcript_16801/g.39604 Transcript_16801/m.39604 type:complete len:274 (-) Transcript_16801:3357-4178(-)